jgi:hypothetical protein
MIITYLNWKVMLLRSKGDSYLVVWHAQTR